MPGMESRGTGANGEEERDSRCRQAACPTDFFDLGERLFDLPIQLFRVRPSCGRRSTCKTSVVIVNPGGHGQADAGHLREVRALAAEQRPSWRPSAVGPGVAEIVKRTCPALALPVAETVGAAAFALSILVMAALGFSAGAREPSWRWRRDPQRRPCTRGRVSCVGVFTGFLATPEALVAEGFSRREPTRVLSAASLLCAAASAAIFEDPFLAGALAAPAFGAGAGVAPRPLLTVLAGAAAGRAGLVLVAMKKDRASANAKCGAGNEHICLRRSVNAAAALCPAASRGRTPLDRPALSSPPLTRRPRPVRAQTHPLTGGPPATARC